MSPAMTIAFVALWVVVLGLAILVLLLYRHFGLVAMESFDGVQREGLPVGARPGPFSAVDIHDSALAWRARPDRHALLLFMSPDCGPCGEVLPQIDRLCRRIAAASVPLDPLVIVPGSSSTARELSERFEVAIPCVGHAEGAEPVFDRFRIKHTPFAFVVGPDGRIAAKGLCNDLEKVVQLLADARLEGVATLLPDHSEPFAVTVREPVGQVTT